MVAKKGKLHQDLTDVNRQIDECFLLSRPLEQGKKDIYLSEVWVVTTSTITPNAKTKIRALHKNSKVHFVSGEDLASLVAKYVPHYWSKIPIEISTYLDRIRTRARDHDQQLDIIQVTDKPIYIEQEIDRITVDPYNKLGKRRARRRLRVDPVAELESHRFMLIEAGMGGGKSKLIRHLVQSIATDAMSASRPWLPVSTTYKDLIDDYNSSLTDLFEATVSRAVKSQLARDARIIFFVDAMDEKEQSQSDMFASLERLANETQSHPRYRLILTSRTIGNLEFDKQFAHAISRYKIRPLTVGKLVEYLKQVCKQLNLTNRIIDDMR